MNSLKINGINHNIVFRNTKNAERLARVIKNRRISNVLLPAITLGGGVGIGMKLREQFIKYDEKEEKIPDVQEDLLDRIMAMTEKIKTKKAAGEEITSEDFKLPSSLLSKNLEARRLPNFKEEDMDEDFYDELDGMDYTPVKMSDFKKKSAIIKNRQLKTIAKAMCKKEDLNQSLLYFIRDVDAGLDNITDKKILKHIKEELKRLADIDYDTVSYDKSEMGQFDYFSSLNRIAAIVDIYNTMTGKYSRLKTADIDSGNVFLEKSRPAEFIEYFKQNAPKSLEKFIEILNTESDKKHYLVADFESSQKTEALDLLSSDKELLDYMYEKYYVSKIADAPAKKLCREINRTYGVRILLSEKTRDIRRALKIIKKELGYWTKVSDGKAKLPRVLNLNSCDSRYYEGAGAYSDIWANIHYDGAKIYAHNIIRHEIMHLNEHLMFAEYTADPELAKLIRSIIASKKTMVDGREKTVLDWDNCKYREEFLKAGIDTEHVLYAYTNKGEFLAVAAEGDLSQYSPEFKEILIKMGMPEYVFDLPVEDIKIKTNVNRVQDILEEHPNATYEELVKYIELKSKELSPREKLLNAIFGRFQKEKHSNLS